MDGQISSTPAAAMRTYYVVEVATHGVTTLSRNRLSREFDELSEAASTAQQWWERDPYTDPKVVKITVSEDEVRDAFPKK